MLAGRVLGREFNSRHLHTTAALINRAVPTLQTAARLPCIHFGTGSSVNQRCHTAVTTAAGFVMRNFTRRVVVYFLLPFVVLTFFACDFGIPASISATGTPGIHLPLGSVFTSIGQNNHFLDEFFDTSMIEAGLNSNGNGTRLFNYLYDRIAVDGASINGDPDAESAVSAVQTYLIVFPVAEIPVPNNIPPGWPVPNIDFYGPSFEAMLGSLLGIQFRYMWCYILIDGISNSSLSPARISLISDEMAFLQSADLIKSTFQIDEADEAAGQFTRAITGASTRGFSLIPLFSDRAGSSPMRIIISSAQPSGSQITVKMLIVLPLTFEVPPEIDENGRSRFVEIHGTRYVKMDVKQLNDMAIDLTEFGNTINTAHFQINDIKNDIFSGIFLAFSKSKDVYGFHVWEENIINLDEGAVNGIVDITGITKVPHMSLITRAAARPDGSETGYISIPPVKKDDENKIINEFDFSITLDAETDFSTSIDLK